MTTSPTNRIQVFAWLMRGSCVWLLFALLSLGCGTSKHVAATESRTESLFYEVSLLRAFQYTGAPNTVNVVLAVEPKAPGEFAPLLSMRAGIVKGADTTMHKFGQRSDGSSVQLIIYGDDIAAKDPQLYAYIEESLARVAGERKMILHIKFNRVVAEVSEIAGFVYGPWEKDNTDIRVERYLPGEVEVL